jgi:hypothetical protein
MSNKVEFEADLREMDWGPDSDNEPQDIFRLAFFNCNVNSHEALDKITTTKRVRVVIENIDD